VRKSRWYEYPRYFFVNHSIDIHRLCGEALDRLGVEWRFSKPTTISVARREAAARAGSGAASRYPSIVISEGWPSPSITPLRVTQNAPARQP
jgi:hypothetical protein